MATPLVHIWRQREVVTAETMNRYITDVHRFLYAPPACKVQLRQRGTHAQAKPSDAVNQGAWLSFNTWKSFPLHMPGRGMRGAETYDNTGGEMAKLSPDGIGWHLIAPEDGLYAVSFGGILESNGQANNIHFRLGRNIRSEGDWGLGTGTVASHCPGPVQHDQYGVSRYFGSIQTTIQLKKSDTIHVSGVADKDFVLGRYDMPNRSALELRWVGRLP
ncbi:hypothetical protein ABT354_11185 [Streptomyces sp. NPDC000594]|uniref:hypothetical protein n=1 Tax=Streptomyces sp. NPDC000594 TaxID=3154261 RepID=UPI00331BEA8D